MKVIGLTGPARAGKDTIAEMIAVAFAGLVIRQGFADKLKLSAARIFDPEIDLQGALDFCNWLKVEGSISYTSARRTPFPLKGVTGRQFLQRYGTEAHRDVFGQDFWLDAVLPEDRDDCDLLVIPDVRFDNEAERVLARGGEVWRVIRPDGETVEAHASEAGIPDQFVTWNLLNDSTLEVLQQTVANRLAGRE